MKKLLLAALAVASVATGANALTLTNAAVTGSGGSTIWTTAQTGNYTLFLQSPNLGDFINPNDEVINFNVANSGLTRVLLAGEGFLPGTNVDSDPLYNLTLTFSGGETLTGQYVPMTNTFTGGSSILSGGVTYSLIEFSYRRFLGDTVQPNVATPGGDGNDYNGNFRINAVVPEPASWAMLIVGFGLVGAAARRRSPATAITA